MHTRTPTRTQTLANQSPNQNPNPNLDLLRTFIKALLAFVRAELGPELGEQLVPLVNGGVQLFGLMHDTCSTANRVADLMVELRERKALEFHGDTA